MYSSGPIVENGHWKDIGYDEIGLWTENIKNIACPIVSTIGMACSSKEKENDSLNQLELLHFNSNS